jgi:hypothetical protein
MSVSLKEYLAGIDVSMGGRVAEELSEHEKLSCRRTIDITITFSSIWRRKCHKWSKLGYHECDPYGTSYGQGE